MSVVLLSGICLLVWGLSAGMDCEVQRDGRILDLIDDAWKEDRLPYEEVTIPLVKRLQVVVQQVNSPATNGSAYTDLSNKMKGVSSWGSFQRF